MLCAMYERFNYIPNYTEHSLLPVLFSTPKVCYNDVISNEPILLFFLPILLFFLPILLKSPLGWDFFCVQVI